MPLLCSRKMPIPHAESTPVRVKLIRTKCLVSNTNAAGPMAGSQEIVAGRFLQRQSNWCWVACARMVANSLAIGLSLEEIPEQAQIVQSWIGQAANVTQNADQIVGLYRSGLLGARIDCAQTNGSLSQQTILDEIGADRPVEIGLTFHGGGGHVVIVAGFVDLGNGTVKYIVHDPASGEHLVGFADLCRAGWIAPGQWSLAFHQFTKF